MLKDESKDFSHIELNRISVVPSLLCGTPAPLDDITNPVWYIYTKDLANYIFPDDFLI